MLQWIPDYDLHMKRSSTPQHQFYWHEDRNVTSEALNLRLSFYWRSLVDQEMMKTFRKWNTPPYHSTPDYIVMGTTAENEESKLLHRNSCLIFIL